MGALMEDRAYEKMNIQWFPGHMTKAQRMIEQDLKLVDAVCEILDARIPRSSRNPDIDRLAGDKPRLLILNRTDRPGGMKLKVREKNLFPILKRSLLLSTASAWIIWPSCTTS